MEQQADHGTTPTSRAGAARLASGGGRGRWNQLGRRLGAQSERNWWLCLSTPSYPWFPAGSQQQQHGSRRSSAPRSLCALANSTSQNPEANRRSDSPDSSEGQT
ncbi:hypothetical protein NDU88_004732 [Pleurodeles waltl]|uniref:Uncharacterized protein n=1 Tax=Pleurodeles waltl TaxID=8319 RepID=A0AAV7MCJ1_PLEWA|nr:hypothetical protein NDU88_004732 [Pleurodeles waltl]